MAQGRKKVLWVDDEIEFLRSHIMFLETRGYSVTPTFSGDDAIELIHKNPQGYDIVLLDEQMPGKDGLTTLEEIKALLPDMPVVMVTKSEEEQLMEDALGKKIDGYLTKPVNPSQILSVCKRLIDARQIMSSQLSQQFVRSYSENRQIVGNPMDARGWERLYENFTRWDVELAAIDDEGLRQMHAGQKSDSNAAYADFIEAHYGRWIRGNDNPPPLAVQVMERFVFPQMQNNRRVCVVVLSGLRFDQFNAIEALCRPHYSVQRHTFFSILPTMTPYARSALFAGCFPLELQQRSPELWQAVMAGKTDVYGTLLDQTFEKLGLKQSRPSPYYAIRSNEEAAAVLQTIATLGQVPLCSMVVDVLSMAAGPSLLQQLAPDEPALRSFTMSWFQHSPVFQILKELGRLGSTVVLASDHGSILCSRGTDVYGAPDLNADSRCLFGTNMTCDERHAIFLSDPSAYRLPHAVEGETCIIAKENFYFKRTESFDKYNRTYRNVFLSGGISMEEMIMPLAILTPK